MPIPTQKLVIILRGLPGSGKSFIAKKYLSHIKGAFGEPTELDPDEVILSSDDYFIQDKVYRFDKDKIQESHKWNWERFRESIEKESPLIIVDNTNIKKFHYSHYLDYASRHNYLTGIFIIPFNETTNRELSERNIHGVDQETIRRMRKAFEWEL
jgi:tRNA uridine 5-carbamoylmethylation protein Kti12